MHNIGCCVCVWVPIPNGFLCTWVLFIFFIYFFCRFSNKDPIIISSRFFQFLFYFFFLIAAHHRTISSTSTIIHKINRWWEIHGGARGSLTEPSRILIPQKHTHSTNIWLPDETESSVLLYSLFFFFQHLIRFYTLTLCCDMCVDSTGEQQQQQTAQKGMHHNNRIEISQVVVIFFNDYEFRRDIYDRKMLIIIISCVLCCAFVSFSRLLLYIFIWCVSLIVRASHASNLIIFLLSLNNDSRKTEPLLYLYYGLRIRSKQQ